MRNFLIILFIAIIVLGCGSGRKRYEAGLQSLEGKHIDEFYRAWGPPNSKADLSTGDYIVSWGKQSIKSSGTYTTTSQKSTMLPNGQLISVPVNQTHGGGTHTRSCEIRVEFSPEGFAKTLDYQGGSMCDDWFPVPEVE